MNQRLLPSRSIRRISQFTARSFHVPRKRFAFIERHVLAHSPPMHGVMIGENQRRNVRVCCNSARFQFYGGGMGACTLSSGRARLEGRLRGRWPDGFLATATLVDVSISASIFSGSASR
jgi:hypothetical protein